MQAIFDQLAKARAAGVSRRTLLARLAQGLLAGVLGATGLRATAAFAQSCYDHCKLPCIKNGVLDFNCYRQCVTTDVNNCGSCGHRCGPGQVCGNGVCTTASGDAPTAETLAAADAALRNGALNVAYNPSGTLRYRRFMNGTALVADETLDRGRVIVHYDYSSDRISGYQDSDRDGFAEWRTQMHLVSPGVLNQVEKEFSPGSTKPFRKKTVIYTPTQVFVTLEELNASGALEVVDSYSYLVASPTVAGRTSSSRVNVAATFCNQCDPISLNQHLLAALSAGAKCLRNKGAKDLAERLEHNYHKNTGRVQISCRTLPADTIAQTSWTPGGSLNFVIPTTVDVNSTYWCGLTGDPLETTRKLSLLFHELIHFNGPNEDDVNERNLAQRHELERTYACESLCFGFPPATRCSCAVCLETTSCDADCKSLGSCATTEKDVQSDPNNCGACDQKCAECQTCAQGACLGGGRACGNVCCSGPCERGGTGCCPQPRICGNDCCTVDQTCVTRLDGTKFCCQSGWECPCPSGPNAHKVFPTRTQCEVACPSGLACFGFSQCDPVSCPPP